MSDDSLVLLEPHHCVIADIVQVSYATAELCVWTFVQDVLHGLGRRVVVLADCGRSHSPFVEHISSSVVVAPNSVQSRPLTSSQGEARDFTDGIKDQMFARKVVLFSPTFLPIGTDVELLHLQTRPDWVTRCYP